MTAAVAHALPHDSWRSGAACRDWPDPDDFFPDHTARRPVVLLVCGRCPVVQACREEALTSQQRYGVWGGLTELDRDRLAGRGRRGRADTLSA